MGVDALSRLAPSAKTRRRLLWTAGLALPVTAIALVVVLVPERSSIGGGTTVDEGPAQLADTHHYRLTAAQRRQIDTLLDAFIPAAVERKSPANAWALAGPELRASSSLAAWRAGNSPVPAYEPRGSRFHYWTVVEVDKDAVLFNILLHPRRKQMDSYEFSGQVVRRHGRWLVNRLYTIATFSPSPSKHVRITGPNDYAAGSGGSVKTAHGRISRFWLVPVLGVVLGGVILVPLGLGIVAWSRARRFRRESAARSRVS
jgi:hypothetical protein